MQKDVKSFRFSTDTLEKIKELKEDRGFRTDTEYVEYLIQMDYLHFKREKVESLSIPDIINLLNHNGLHLEVKDDVLYHNGRVGHFSTSKYDIYPKLRDLGFDKVEKVAKEIMEHLSPGYLKRKGVP